MRCITPAGSSSIASFAGRMRIAACALRCATMRLHLSLYVVMESGGNVPVVGAEVQRRVADAIDRMLALRVEEVNVFVSEVAFA